MPRGIYQPRRSATRHGPIRKTKKPPPPEGDEGSIDPKGVGVGLADLDDALVVAEQDDANRDTEASRDRRSAGTEADNDGEGGVSGERDRVLPVHPDAAVAVVHRTAVCTSSVLRNSSVEAATRTSEHHRTDVHDGLREVPGQNAVVHEVLEGLHGGNAVVERLRCCLHRGTA